ncbi:50S ribosomal protein L29 [Buchnera aphidicola (Ceratoglyphina bambusae)]|uniref:50S ribosomal protein L29 n=1 Tax=Buchnera aphidicola TaxID=9 RepID=UPI0031B8198B
MVTKNNIKNINNINNRELMVLLKEYFNIKIQFFSGKLTQTHLLKLCRKKIARVKHLININKVKNK